MTALGRIVLLNLIGALGRLRNTRRAELLLYIAKARPETVPVGFRFSLESGTPRSRGVRLALTELEQAGLVAGDRLAGGIDWWLTSRGLADVTGWKGDARSRAAIEGVRRLCCEYGALPLARLEEAARALASAPRSEDSKPRGLQTAVADAGQSSSFDAIAWLATGERAQLGINEADLDKLQASMHALVARFREVEPSGNQITAGAVAEYAYIALARSGGIRSQDLYLTRQLTAQIERLQTLLESSLRRANRGEPIEEQSFDEIREDFDRLQSACARHGVLPSLRQWPIDYGMFSVQGTPRGFRN